MRIVIRAFTKDGYHRDLMVANEAQVLMQNHKLGEATSSLWSGLIGHGVQLDPKEFPEVEHFEFVIQDK